MFKLYSRSKTTTITNFILDEIKRSISISVYYRWKRSIKNGRWREIDLKIIFWLQISYSPHSGNNTKIKWDMCLCILNIILKYAVGTCLWLYWKLTLNTHFLLDFIYSWLSLSRIWWDHGKNFESTIVRLKRSYENTGSVVCLTTKGRQLEQNFEELKPASHVSILGTI